MELTDYIRVVRRRWKIIVTTFLMVVAAAVAFTVLTEPEYRAQAELYVSTVSAETPADLAQGSNFTQRQVATYADVATTPFVLGPVIEELDLDLTPQQLAGQVTVQAPANTVILQVSVVDGDPALALDVAEAVSGQLVQALADLDQVGQGSTSPIKATIVTPAAVSDQPVSPQPLRNIALAVVLGLLLGVAAALIRDLLDTSIRSEADARALTDIPVLAAITFNKEAARSPRLVMDNPHHAHSEAFRALRTNLQFVNAGDPAQSIVLTSSLPEEGKTTTVAHLALTLAATGQKVCVVEGDLRRPRLLDYLGLEGAVGLTNVLIGEADLDDMVQGYGDTSLSLLGSGPLPPNPAELLGSDRMRTLIHDLEQRFDIVLIDAPPLLPVTDAAVLASITDGAIVVVGAGIVRNEHLTRTLDRMDQAQGQVLGLILNKLANSGVDAYYDYTVEYRPDRPAESPAQPSKGESTPPEQPRSTAGSSQRASTVVKPQRWHRPGGQSSA
ncbi:MAG: polysaccharide biosynthesis tyrosine autokinase [Ornithinimicrobium sp.]